MFGNPPISHFISEMTQVPRLLLIQVPLKRHGPAQVQPVHLFRRFKVCMAYVRLMKMPMVPVDLNYCKKKRNDSTSVVAQSLCESLKVTLK